jgi:hypothetical protein
LLTLEAIDTAEGVLLLLESLELVDEVLVARDFSLVEVLARESPYITAILVVR